MSIVDNYKEKYGKEFAHAVIQRYIKDKGYVSVEAFLKDNPDVNTFEQNSHVVGTIRTHGYFILNEEEYQKIIKELKEEELRKNKLKTENLTTTNANGHEIVTYKDDTTGESVIVDNSVTHKDMEGQMLDVQKKHEQFQGDNPNNTINIMHYLAAKKMVTPDTISTDTINLNNVKEEEIGIVTAAKQFEIAVGHPVRLDLNSKIIYDGDSIYTIEKRDSGYQVFFKSGSPTKKEEPVKGKSMQLTKKIPTNISN